jgi:RNA polymerase sigma-70 factor (ECF subfamily)
MSQEKDLIKQCQQGKEGAFEQLYRQYAPTMFGICLRFAKNKMEAEDILQEGFIKVFTNLKKFKFKGSFEGWLRKTMINTAINHYKKTLKFNNDVELESVEISSNFDQDIIDKISINEILIELENLPDGYRMVFNLNVLEGFTHKMIAKKLGISENTSKSQLLRAKRVLQEKLKKRIQKNG